MTITLATVTTEFLERKGLAQSTLQSYELSLMPLLKEYGSYPIARLHRRKPNPEKGEHHADGVIRYLSPEQIASLYQVVERDGRMKALVCLLHRMGARIAEILSLQLAEINLKERKFQVIGKGNKTRWCFYSEDAATALEKYLKYYQHTESPALFTTQQPVTGKVTRLSYQAAHRDWTKLTNSCYADRKVRYLTGIK